MAVISQIFKKIRGFKFYPHFAVELLLLLILAFTVGTNINLRTNFAGTGVPNRSLFFVHLKNNLNLNQKLVQTYESVDHKLTQTPYLTKQILAASAKEKKEDAAVPASPLPTLSGSALLKPNPPAGSDLLPKRDIAVYEVRGGDTVARIASAFGISEDTIIQENKLSSTGMIKPGQELKILPTTGVKHVVKDGETISGIAKKYGVDEEDVIEYNEIELAEHIFPGEEIIIPNGTQKAPPTPQRQQYLADLQKEDYKKIDVPDYQGSGEGLIWPMPGASRISQYFRSRHRALDIPCKDCPVVAAAAGVVELSGWLKGYGNNIVINHGNGAKTRYAHAKQLLVSAGENVTQGQTIMISGNTGRSTGPHLHFEVIRNGALLNPLTVVQR